MVMIFFIGNKISWKWAKLKLLNNMLIYVNANPIDLEDNYGMILYKLNNDINILEVEKYIGALMNSIANKIKKPVYPEFYDIKVINDNSKNIIISTLNDFFILNEFSVLCEKSLQILKIKRINNNNFLVSTIYHELVIDEDTIKLMLFMNRWKLIQ